MIKITLKDLIYIVPNLINLFLSGFIFISTYNWINNKKYDVSILLVQSLFISVLVKAFYSALHVFILPNYSFNNSIKILVYSLTGFLLAFISTRFMTTKFPQKFLYIANNKSINDNIFDDMIDYKKRTMMKIYIKSSDIYYLGRFAFREEKGIESWIALIDYYCLNIKDDDISFDPGHDNLKSSVVINLREVERIEIIYENDSEVWNRLTA